MFLDGKAAWQLAWSKVEAGERDFGHSTLFSIFFQSTQADIHKYEFCENFILMLFFLCKVISRLLTSCLRALFFFRWNAKVWKCWEKQKSPLLLYAISFGARSSYKSST